MLYATKISMKRGCENSESVLEIDQIYVDDFNGHANWYKKADLYDLIRYKNGVIKVYRSPYPVLEAVLSVNGEKYVRSEANNWKRDNLLALPRY